MDRRLVAAPQHNQQEITASCGAQQALRSLCAVRQEERLGIHRPDDGELLPRLTEHQRGGRRPALLHIQERQVHQRAAVRQAIAGGQQVVARFEIINVPRGAAFLVFHQAGAFRVQAGQRIMAVVFRHLHGAAGGILQAKRPGRGHLLGRTFPEVHVHPAAVLQAILRLAGHGVQARRETQRPAEGHEEDVAPEGIGLAGPPDGDRGRAELLRIASFDQRDAVAHPAHHRIRRVQPRCDPGRKHFPPEGAQLLQFHARRGDVRIGRAAGMLERVVQHIPGHVALVLLGQAAQQALHFRAVQSFQTRIAMRMGVTDGVLLLQPALILRLLLHAGRDGDGILRRRDDVHIHRKTFPEAVVQSHGDRFAGGHREAETLPLARPHEQVAQARVQRRLPVGAGLIGGHRVELGIIVYMEGHRGALDRAAAVLHRHDRPTGRDIAADHIDLGKAGRALDDIFATVVIAIDLGMQQESARHGSVEPGVVQRGGRLAGTHEMPFPVHPYLHPGVVVVRMGPSGRIDLPGRNTGGAQGGDRQHGLLAAAADTPADRRHRAARAGVRRPVGRLLVAPVVDLQRRVRKGKTRHAGAERVGIDRPEIVQRLIVDAQRQHEMPELPLGNVPAHGPAHLQGLGDILLPEAARILQAVRKRHGRIEPFDVFFLAGAAGDRKQQRRQQGDSFHSAKITKNARDSLSL